MSLPKRMARIHNASTSTWKPQPCAKCWSTKRPEVVEILKRKHYPRSGTSEAGWQAKCVECGHTTKAGYGWTGRIARYYARGNWNKAYYELVEKGTND